MTDNDGLSNGVFDVKCNSLWDMFQIPVLGDMGHTTQVLTLNLGQGYANCSPQIKFSPLFVSVYPAS